jgi:hypothetical protein
MKYIEKILRIKYLLCVFAFLSFCQLAKATKPLVTHDKEKSTVSISSGEGQLMFRLKYNDGCYFDQVKVNGKQVLNPEKGVSSSIKVYGQWFSTRDKNTQAQVTVNDNSLLVENIIYGAEDYFVEESWHLTALQDAIEWRIQRRINGVEVLEDAASAEWVFDDMQVWTGAILDNGCVAWNRLLEDKNMTYGSHAGKVLFWNVDNDNCLEIDPIMQGKQQIASRFSHNSDDTHSFIHTLSESVLKPRVDLSRFLRDSQQIWKPFQVNNNTKTVSYRISAPGYKTRFDLGDFNGVDEDAVREILNTIIRYGTIDTKLTGANGWRTGYVCLHEQWFAQMAMAIQDEAYTQNVSDTYDHFRDYGVQPDGRVLARFKDNGPDAMPGTYTSQGFYEAQWGYLMDSQPCYVMVVAEQFHNTGDLNWVHEQKKTCEAVLDYMLKRDRDGDGLLEMMNESHKDERGSDWIDVMWAAHENALVNAEMYGAMILWAEVEEILGDQQMAERYRKAAEKLKDSFNKDITDGGFWNSEKKWYVYWREKDNSVYGNNLVIPVNFSAIGYGLCDDKSRQADILSQLETEMKKEDLFSWPLCIFPYEPDIGMDGRNYPFPSYENGDIFLSWVELGTRSYAEYNPRIAMKYINNIIRQYQKDGLAHQRNARASQSGLGNDILAGNGMAVVGLYRNIFGIQPKYNRLYLEPHLTEELNNTELLYNLRGTEYRIILKTDRYQLSANHLTISASRPFGVNVNANKLEYYEGKSSIAKLSFEKESKSKLHIVILDDNKWGLPVWTVESKNANRVSQTISGLIGGLKYQLKSGSEVIKEKVANQEGQIIFSLNLSAGQTKELSLLAIDIKKIRPGEMNID